MTASRTHVITRLGYEFLRYRTLPRVTGAAGRMGKRLVSLVNESSRLQLAGATEAEGHPALGKDAGDVAGCGPLGVSLTDDLAQALPLSDVVIDFTSPAATLHHLSQAVQHKRAMVIGTTGLSPDEMNQLRQHAESIPCVQAPNMSVGITVLLQMIGKVARALGDDYDLEIIDAHHNKKKDAPSGTALKLADVLAVPPKAGTWKKRGSTRVTASSGNARKMKSASRV